ncbi:hypothetical protein [Reichenbachiella sp.]|uniref:hypothetical protein n=1 Tax=Reichenbachiella sp. TaxID=2184521 RepID=UPI0032975B65
MKENSKNYGFEPFVGWRYATELISNTAKSRNEEVVQRTFEEICRSNREIERSILLYRSNHEPIEVRGNITLYIRKLKGNTVQIKEIDFRNKIYTPQDVQNEFSSEDLKFLSDNSSKYQLMFTPYPPEMIHQNIHSIDGIRVLANKKSKKKNINSIVKYLTEISSTEDKYLSRAYYETFLYLTNSNGSQEHLLGFMLIPNDPVVSWKDFILSIKRILNTLVSDEDSAEFGYELIINNGSPAYQIIEKHKEEIVPVTDYDFPVFHIDKSKWSKVEELKMDVDVHFDNIFSRHPQKSFPVMVYQLGSQKMWCIYMTKEDPVHSKKYLLDRLISDCLPDNKEVVILVPWDKAVIEVHLNLINKGLYQPVNGIENLDEDSISKLKTDRLDLLGLSKFPPEAQ